jgi:hypothetical protein
MKTATFVKSMEGFAGQAELFKLSNTITGHKYNAHMERENIPTGFVIVSAANTFDRGPETFIFPADSTGTILSWGELDGSLYDELDIDKALQGAGYKVTR